MDWLLLIVNPKNVPLVEIVSMAEMGHFAGEVARAGKARGGGPLHAEAEGARVSVRSGRANVVDGPFAESKEVVAGFFAIDAATRDEAIALAERCPAARGAYVDAYAAPDRDVGGPADGSHFMLLLYEGPDLRDPDGAKYRAMVAFDGELKREGSYVESSQLSKDPTPARVAVRGGRTSVTDGPFAEAKEVAGGYFVVRAPDRGAAIELAKRCPHARWGTIEVRQVMKIGPT
jgi:hypothetical protein